VLPFPKILFSLRLGRRSESKNEGPEKEKMERIRGRRSNNQQENEDENEI
jgi:hypothetical protein